MNAAIFNAAGPSLEAATKEKAKTLLPGGTVVVPLPSDSPLFSREGVTHVIHVLGPNMNPQRPNCLDNDYATGCKILRDAYTSLFEGFASIVRKLSKDRVETLTIRSKQSEIQDHCENVPKTGDQKVKRDGAHEADRMKKSRSSHSETGGDIRNVNPSIEKLSGTTTKAWGSWAQALYNIAKQPEIQKDVVLEISDDVVVVNDLYPKVNLNPLNLYIFLFTILLLYDISNN